MPVSKKPQVSAIARKYTTLNLGSGERPMEGALNVDVVKDVKPDVVHDLDVFPYPLPDDQFDKIVCQDVVEHLTDVVRVMEELVRVAKNGAEISIRVPHFSSANAHTDITHKHFFGIRSMEYFRDEGVYTFYTKARVELISHHVSFPPYGLSLFGKLFYKYWPKFWETNLHGIIPAENITFNLRVIKD